MSMTKMDYGHIAAILKRWRQGSLTMREKGLMDQIANNMANEFRQRNPAFDKPRFLEACGCEAF
jgi:hypothetical protein